MKRKVLFMAKAFGGGGAEVAMLELINKMPEEKYEITLALLDNDLEYFNRLNRKINIVQIEFKSSFLKNLVSMYSLPAKVLKKLTVNRYIPYYDYLLDSVKNEFDECYDLALDFYGYGYFLTAFMAKKIHAKKKATWLHDEDLVWWYKSVERYTTYFDRVFAVSNAVKYSFCNAFPSYREKCEVFYNVIDTNLIREKSEMEIADKLEGENILLSVGRLHNQKGFDIAIKAAKIIKEKGINYKWYVIGEGKERSNLEKMISQYDLKDYFILMGRKDNPYVYMKQCDLYIQPSRHEGYVITLVEARALCLPIISSDIPSAREQIIDGTNGFLAGLDENSLANKIIEVVSNPTLKNKVVFNLKNNIPNFDNELKKLEW